MLHAQLKALLLKHLSPATAALFASPSPFEGGVEWYSDLGGQPQPFTSLADADAQRAQHVLQEQLISIRQLAQRLECSGDAAAIEDATLLRRAARDPVPETWYVLNGQPVLTSWGTESGPAAASTPAPPVTPPAAAATALAASKASRWRRAWLLAPLLIVAAVLLWQFGPDRMRKIMACMPVASPLPPELALVFDASLSMQFSMRMNPDEAEALFRGRGGDCFAPERRLPLMLAGLDSICEQLTAPPQRMVVAKQAARAALQELPAEMGVGVVLIEQCPAAREAGFFAPGQRAQLLAAIDDIRAVQGTPLADAVARAGAMLDGVKRDSFMLVISDGNESCSEDTADPCAVAAQLAKAKPRLRINVVDITGKGAGNCLAAATGGKVFEATQADRMTERIHAAMQELVDSANCM